MREPSPLRTGVVGLGYFGSFHAEKYATLPGCELVAGVDHHIEKASKVAFEHDIQAFTDHMELVGLVDAVSIATPADSHFEVARDLINAGIHVLIEKPVTTTTQQAQQLIALAKEKNVILQVGHLERFNPAFTALPQRLRSPNYIETHRLTRFQGRGHDVSVVLDLMIHDIDLVLSLSRSPLKRVEAKGVSVYSETPDLVNAVLYFANDDVANLTASRVSIEPERSLHLFQQHAYACLDMQHKTVTMQEQADDGEVKVATLELENEDCLRTEVASFVESAKARKAPVVTGEAGLLALDTAKRITQAIEQGQSASEPLLVQKARTHRNGRVTYDRHPETREPFFSRTSLLDSTSPSNSKDSR